jgi:hypothetical protein
MSWENNEAFGGRWDIGEHIITDLISHPVKMMIDRDAERAGIDLSNFERTIGSGAASTFLGAAWGTFLGPIGSILGGLMGYAIGIGSKYPTDGKTSYEDYRVMLKMKAFGVAIDVLKQHVSRDGWNAICDAVNYTLQSLKSQYNFNRRDNATFAFIYDKILQAIERIDRNIAWNFAEVFNTSCEQLGTH